MPYITDPNTGQQVWDGETVPAASRESIRNSIAELNADLTAITARVAALEALLTSLPDGSDNVYLGGTPSPDLDGAIENVFVGARAGGVITTGNQNVGIGTEALELCTEGSSMIAIGESSLENVITGIRSIGIGDSAGSLGDGGAYMYDMTNCIYIGWASFSGNAGSATNEIVIGGGAVGAGDDTVTIGNASTETIYMNGAVSSTKPYILPSYTVSTLPTPATNAQGIIYVSNGTSNKRLAVCDGTNWRWPDGAIVS